MDTDLLYARLLKLPYIQPCHIYTLAYSRSVYMVYICWFTYVGLHDICWLRIVLLLLIFTWSSKERELTKVVGLKEQKQQELESRVTQTNLPSPFPQTSDSQSSAWEEQCARACAFAYYCKQPDSQAEHQLGRDELIFCVLLCRQHLALQHGT